MCAALLAANLALVVSTVALGTEPAAADVDSTPSGAVRDLETFKQQASNPRYVPSESARDQLTAAADQLIAQLTGT
ncbi:MAG: FIMAH domain-containing protein [Jiangellaceae bacterium]